MNKCSCCSPSSLAFTVANVPDFGHSNRYIVVSHCCFSFSHDKEHLFICLSDICISSLGMCLLRSLAHFSIRLFVFLLLSFKRSLCHLG